MPNRAMKAVSADNPIYAVLQNSPGARAKANRNAIVVLLKRNDLGFPLDSNTPTHGMVFKKALRFILRKTQYESITRLQGIQRQPSDPLTVAVKAQGANPMACGQKIIHHAHQIEHFERASVNSDRPGGQRSMSCFFNQTDRDSITRKLVSHDQARRTGADNKDIHILLDGSNNHAACRLRFLPRASSAISAVRRSKPFLNSALTLSVSIFLGR